MNEKPYVIKDKYNLHGKAYPNELRPTGHWNVQKFTEDGHSCLFIENRCGGRGDTEWVSEDQIHFIEIYEN